ncbi:MAG: serine hydrolase domain-containing protein [Gemmatimonadota bacterium]|jgi:CubicO group peptidase (beta-lactamase class C family)
MIRVAAPRWRALRSALVGTLLGALPAAASARQAEPIVRLGDRLAADVKADSVGSIAAAVIVDTTIVWADAFGLADRDRALAADAQTIYRVGSISKSMTAVVLMRLVERGTVRLDDPVMKYLPEFTELGGGLPEARTITLRQLASHTGGLVREPALEGAAAGPIAEWEHKVVASIPTTTLWSAPGTGYSYSNIGYGILGLALSRAAGEPFMDLTTRLLFQPLGMTSSTFTIRPPLDRRLSAGYENGRDGSVDARAPALEQAGRGYKVPNGGVYSTVHDLARFIALMTGALGDDVLPAAARAGMLRRQTPGDAGQGYGLGFFVRTDSAGNRLAWHSGSVAGYTAMILFDPDRRIGAVLLRNYARGRTNLRAAAETVVREMAAVRDRGTSAPRR